MTGRRFHLLSIFTMLLGLLLFFSDISHKPYARGIFSLVDRVVAPVMGFKERTVSELREELSAYFHRVDVAKENVRLKRRLNELLLTERELEACREELESIRDAVRVSSSFKRLDHLTRRVIYYDPTGFDLFLVIDGGKNLGIEGGELVVTEGSVLGMVESVFSSTSRVITVYNDRFSIAAIVGKKGKRYIYRGGFPEGHLLHVKLEDEVREGEEVYLAEQKVPPFLIGKVKEVRRGKDPFFKEVKVKPEAVPRAEEYVFLIRGAR